MTEHNSNERKYSVPNSDGRYTFDEIKDAILKGKLIKKSIIWEPGLPDWVKLKDHPDFKQIFEVYEKAAEEHMKKALGEDEESIKKRELRDFLVDNDGDEVKAIYDGMHPGVKLIILLLILSGIVAGGYFGYQKLSEKAVKPVVTKKKEIKKLNLDDIRFSSGVSKIDKIIGTKEIAVKHITKSEEEKILAEVLMEIKKEEAAKKTEKKDKTKVVKSDGNKKIKRSLFDKVSEDEINSFRKSLLSKSKFNGKTVKAKKKNDFFEKGEELTSKQVAAVVKNNYKNVKYCYEKALKSDAHLSGKMELTLHIIGSGRVAKIETKPRKFKGSSLDRCVRGQIKKKWKFPKFNGTLTTVTLPFVLTAQ